LADEHGRKCLPRPNFTQGAYKAKENNKAAKNNRAGDPNREPSPLRAKGWANAQRCFVVGKVRAGVAAPAINQTPAPILRKSKIAKRCA